MCHKQTKRHPRSCAAAVAGLLALVQLTISNPGLLG